MDIRQVRPVSQVGHQHPAQLLSISAANEFGSVGIMTERLDQPPNNWPNLYTFTRLLDAKLLTCHILEQLSTRS